MTSNCGVCLSAIKQPYQTPCKHVFCKRCILNKVSLYSKCPNCHSKVENHELVPFSQNASKESKNVDDSTHAKKPNVERVVLLQLNRDKIQGLNLPNCTVTTQLDSTVTHVVLDEETPGYAKNTTKYRMCVLHGVVIVNPNWLTKSIKAEKLLDTTSYRIRGDVDHRVHDASINSAFARSQGRRNILYGLQVDLKEDDGNEIRNYLLLSKAEIGNYKTLVVCDPVVDIDKLKSQYPNKLIISRNWITESICCYKLLAKQEYLLAVPTTK